MNEDLVKKGQPPINLNDLDLESEEVYKNLQPQKLPLFFNWNQGHERFDEKSEAKLFY